VMQSFYLGYEVCPRDLSNEMRSDPYGRTSEGSW
jgi:hypothetical protein